MAKLPLILSIAALIFATGLGIAAKGKADQKMRELAVTHTELKKSEATVATRTTELATANDNLATAGKEIEAKAAEVAKLTGEVKVTKEDLATAVETTKSQVEKITRLETEVNEGKVKLEEGLIAKTMLEAKLADTQKQLEESILALANNKKPAVVHADSPKPAGPVAPPSNLTGSVLAVNEGLNFLVLSVGDRQGVSVHTSMLVVRGGQRVATLKVTSIEPRTSIAEVVPGTMARGQAVQAGDQVVLLRGERKSSGSAPTKAGRSGPAVEPALPEA